MLLTWEGVEDATVQIQQADNVELALISLSEPDVSQDKTLHSKEQKVVYFRH